MRTHSRTYKFVTRASLPLTWWRTDYEGSVPLETGTIRVEVQVPSGSSADEVAGALRATTDDLLRELVDSGLVV